MVGSNKYEFIGFVVFNTFVCFLCTIWPMDGHPDFYTLLGVAPQAEPEVIRAAYRVLAQRYHPDRLGPAHASASSRMAALNQAYEVLSCPEQRRAYDQWQRQRRATNSPAHATWPEASARVTLGSAPVNVLTTYDRRGRLHAYI
jgi:curved DNA-binding protein CbpA